MANPNRPQYQDTIASTWGQAVADTVVRRYATTAARNADLGGFTPAPNSAGNSWRSVPRSPITTGRHGCRSCPTSRLRGLTGR